MRALPTQYSDLFNDCVCFASKFMELPPVRFFLEECPTKMFPTEVNNAQGQIGKLTSDTGEEYEGGIIVFNRRWLEPRWAEHKDDIQFYIFHELRHLNQLLSVLQLDNGGIFKEKRKIVSNWKDCFENYIRNNGDVESQNLNMAQEVERDANAYGLCLIYLYHPEPDFELWYSLPEKEYQLANKRKKWYWQVKPEFVSYFAEKGMILRNPIKLNTIGRNDSCPCGSGKKYKNCYGS